MCGYIYKLPARRRKREIVENKLKILKRELKHIKRKMTNWKYFVFANPQKNEAIAHCTYLQIAMAYTLKPKFAKECNLALANKDKP